MSKKELEKIANSVLKDEKLTDKELERLKVFEEDYLTEREREKSENFKRVATARLHKIIDRISLLGNIPKNPQNYSYTEEQINNLFSQIEEFTAEMKQRFLNVKDVKKVREKFKIEL